MRSNPVVVVRNLGLAALVALVSSACADSSWQATRARDDVPAYHKYLRKNPDSPNSEVARQRIAFLRVQTHKSLTGYEAFVSKYPQSPWLEELRLEMEPLYFQEARESNTPEAYRAFLSSYPDGTLAERARGNLQWVEAVRRAPTPSLLDAFVREHPESDFAGEAQASLRLVELRRGSQIQSMGVRVEVAPNVAQPQRVARGFAAMVARRYQDLGINVRQIPRGGTPTPDMDAWIRVDYEETQASGVFGGATLISRCRMRIYHTEKGEEEPVWDETFEASAEHVLGTARGRDRTVFGNARYPFWKDFFVPVATWATSEVRSREIEYFDDVAAIDVRGDRAAVLFSRGGYDILDISTPDQPATIDRYRRDADLSRWTGISLATEELVILYGPDGAEVVERSVTKPKVVGRWELPEIGAIRTIDVYGKTALLAGSRGVYALRLEQRPLKPHRMLEGDYVGVEVAEPYIYLIGPNRVEVTSPKHLLRHLTGSRVGLGKNFGATRARRIGRSLYVFGKNETVEVSLERPGRPRVVGKLDPEKLGSVVDVTGVDGWLYVMGDRGLQVATPDGNWVADAIQVDARRELSRRGHWLFLVGDRRLEVLNIGPYVMDAPAAPAPPAAPAEDGSASADE